MISTPPSQGHVHVHRTDHVCMKEPGTADHPLLQEISPLIIYISRNPGKIFTQSFLHYSVPSLESSMMSLNMLN